MARATYQRLIKLQPQAARWKERLAQLQPGTIAVWNFDSDPGAWKNAGDCSLAVRDGVLKLTQTGMRASWSCDFAPALGGNVLAIRYRRERPCGLEYSCGDPRGDIQQAPVHSVVRIPGTAGEWSELLLPLSYADSLEAIRIDFDLGSGQSIEIDDIALRQVNAAEFSKLWLDLVIEPTLVQLKAEIERAPQEVASYVARATYLIRLGRWREAVEDCRQARQLKPTDRFAWFREANCRLLADDFAGYQQLCREMLEQFRKTDDVEIADSLCKTCLLRPDAVKVADLPLEFVRASVNDPRQSANQHWFYVCCGLAAYRDGNLEEALAWVKLHPSYLGNSGAMALMVRAMIEHQSGRRDEARATLTQAERLIPAALRVRETPRAATQPPFHPGDIVGDALANEVLRREAAKLIRGEP